MNTLRIESNPSYVQDRICSVAESIKSRLGRSEELTHANAIRILRSIKWQTDVHSFILKPNFNIPFFFLVDLLLVKCLQYALASRDTPEVMLCSATLALTTLVTTHVVTSQFYFHQASCALKQKSEEAARYLKTLENSLVPLKVLV